MDELVTEFAATYPKLASISQGKGMPTDVQLVINQCEIASQLPIDERGNIAKDRDGEEMTLLPRTRCEFEMGEKLSKIKAIRGLTPKKDVKISLGSGFSAVSNLNADFVVACVEMFDGLQIHRHGLVDD